MKNLISLLLAIVVLSCQTAAAKAVDVEGEISLNTSYINAEPFNDRFSSEPTMQATTYVGFDEGAYVEVYAYSGFKDFFNDAGSEYGVELGQAWEIEDGVSFGLSAGRWMNYGGEGHRVGDWFVRTGLDSGNLSLSAYLLAGESDTAILYASYEWSLTERFSLSPSLSYVTEGRILNPGLQGELVLTNQWVIGIQLVYPEDERGDRHLRHDVAIIWRW